MVSKNLSEGRIEKSVPWDHCLSSLDKPRDAKQRSSGRIFLSYPHTHDRFLYELCNILKLLPDNIDLRLINFCQILHDIRVYS